MTWNASLAVITILGLLVLFAIYGLVAWGIATARAPDGGSRARLRLPRR